jgi:hypothetical protein
MKMTKFGTVVVSTQDDGKPDIKMSNFHWDGEGEPFDPVEYGRAAMREAIRLLQLAMSEATKFGVR